MRPTAKATTPATHCTVVVMARMLRVPTEPSALRYPRKPQPSSGSAGGGRTVAIGSPSSGIAAGNVSSRSWTQQPAAIGCAARPIVTP